MARFVPSIEEVPKAIYIDYEARKQAPPVLIGILRVLDEETSFRQEVVHPDFRPAAKTKKLEYRTLQESLDRLAAEVSATGAAVIAWSEHELDYLFPYASAEALDILTAAYRNAIQLAERWQRTLAPNWKPESNALAAYMSKMRFHVPEKFGPKKTGESLGVIQHRLSANGGDYYGMSEANKDRWKAVIGHNKYDCFGMRHVCMTAAADLADITAVRPAQPNP